MVAYEGVLKPRHCNSIQKTCAAEVERLRCSNLLYRYNNK